MALLQLVRRYDDYSDDDTLNLYQYADDIGVASWIPGGEVGNNPVQESLTLNIKSDRSGALRAIDDMIRDVKEYSDAQERYSIWLRDTTGTVSPHRQALITEMAGAPTMGWHDYASSNNEYLTYALALTRIPFWEETETESIITAVSGNGGLIALTAGKGISGTETGRIRQVQISQTTGTSLTKQLWMGFRSTRFGTPSLLQVNWDCGDGDEFANGETVPSGTTMVTTFNETDEENRFTVRISDVIANSSNWDDQRGEFQVLLRASVNTGTAYVRLKDGIFPDTHQAQLTATVNFHQLVKVDSTSPFLYNLGVVSIPGGRGIDTSGFFGKFGLRIAAKSPSGTNVLTCYKFILIPRSEGYLFIDNAALEYTTGTDYALIRVYPEGVIDGWYTDGGYPAYRLVLDPHNFSLPNNQPYIVLAAQTHQQHPTNGVFNMQFDYYPRWRTMSSRG